MDVVARSTNGERLHLILFCDAAEIWPEPAPQIRGEPRFAIFRGPDAMNEATRERMHRLGSVVRVGLDLVYII